MNPTDAQVRLWGQAASRVHRLAGLAGAKLRRSLAAGTEATGQRDYQTGDDYRYIDWARCARHDELVSHKYEAPLPLASYLLIDGAASMTLGDGAKFALARQIAAGFQAFVQAKGDPVCVHLGGAKSSMPVDRIDDTMLPPGGPTDLAAFCRHAILPGTPEGVVVLMSDLMDAQGLTECFASLQRLRQQMFVVHLVDTADAEPSWTGRVRLEGAAGQGAQSAVVDIEDLEDYQRRFRHWLDQTARFCIDRRVGYVRAWTHERPESVLERMLGR